MPTELFADVFSGVHSLLFFISIATLSWGVWKGGKWLLRKNVRSSAGMLTAPPVTLQSSKPTDPERTLDSLSHALESSRQQLTEQSRHLRMLYQVTEQLSHESDLSGVIGVTLESLWRTVELDFVAVVLGDDELGPFHYAGIRGVDDPLSVLGQECAVPLWGTLAHALVHHPQNGESDYLVIHDIKAEGRPSSGEFPWHTEEGSWMIIPMRQAGRTQGAFLIGSRRPNHFHAESVRHYLYAVAGTAARAIQEAISRKQATRWIKQLVSLQSLTHTMTRTRDLETILAVLYGELADLFGEAEIRVFLNRPKRSESMLPGLAIASEPRLQIFAPQPIPTDEKAELVSAKIMALLRWTMEAEQPLFFDPASQPDDVTDFYYRSSGRGLMVPIGEEKSVGVIYLSAPERATPFEEGDLIVVRTISNSIAMALGAMEQQDRYSGVT